MEWENDIDFSSVFCKYVHFIFRRLFRVAFNWFMLMVTGRTELERVLTWKTKNCGQITTEVEKLIDEGGLSVVPRYWDADRENNLVDEILKVYCVETDNKQYEQLKNTLKRSLSQIRGYRELCDVVEKMRMEKFDPKNKIHEKRLLKLWNLLMPNEDLEARITSQWQKIGFQGNDPSTDFRGMGVLSLEQLIFLAQYDVAAAQSILSFSNHPSYGFPMAVTGVNLTALTRQLLQEDALKMHFYNTIRGEPTIDNFHHVFCQIFKLFCAYWMKRKPELIQFNDIKSDFKFRLMKHLLSQEANLDRLKVSHFE